MNVNTRFQIPPKGKKSHVERSGERGGHDTSFNKRVVHKHAVLNRPSLHCYWSGQHRGKECRPPRPPPRSTYWVLHIQKMSDSHGSPCIIYKYGRGKQNNMVGHMRPVGRGLAIHELDETCRRVWQRTMLHLHSFPSQLQNAAPIAIFKKITKWMEMNRPYQYQMCVMSLHCKDTLSQESHKILPHAKRLVSR